MALLSEAFGIENPYGFESTKQLANDSISSATDTKPTSVSIGEAVDRTSKVELRNAYISVPIVFNSVNKNTQTIMGAKREVRYMKDKTKDFFEKFLVFNLGKFGKNETWEEVQNNHYKNAQIYGENFVERVFDGSKIVDWVTLNPERMDYARDLNGGLVLDQYGKPVGYVQKIPSGVDTTGKGDAVPKEVFMRENGIFLLPKRIAHFKLYSVGDGYDSYGLIEPAYEDIIYKRAIEKANANAIVQRGLNPVIDYVGKPERYPTPQMIDHATKKLSEMKYKTYFAFPYWHDVKTLKFENSELVTESLKNYTHNISASLGIPFALASGSGEATNRATLATQKAFQEFTLNDIVKRTKAFFERELFMPTAETNGLKSVPSYIVGDIGGEDKKEKSERLVKYVSAGILPAEFVLPYAVEVEELDVSKEEIKKVIEDIKKNKIIKKQPEEKPEENSDEDSEKEEKEEE